MAERNHVDYVGSTDYDSLLYGAPKIVKNLTLSTKRRLPSGIYVSVTPELIELREIERELKKTVGDYRTPK